MPAQAFPVIDLAATGANIRQLRLERGMTAGICKPTLVFKNDSTSGAECH